MADEISRRAFGGALGALAVGAGNCEPLEEKDTMPPRSSFPLAPWQMWGTSQDFPNVVIAPIGVTSTTTNQLARVNYKRPESWNFFFKIDVLDCSNPALPYTLIYSFDLIIGVGRSSVIIADFCTFTFVKTGGAPGPAYPLTSWATEVTSPPRFQDVTTPANNALTQTCKEFTAEDIQCSVRTAFTSVSPGAPNTSSFRATAFFAPVNHIRPDWYGGGREQFKGNETGGT